MKSCRECDKEVSEQATVCPSCGAPKPSNPDWNGYGIEYKSATCVFGMPLLHISFRYTAQRRPVPAHGIIAIGQFATGFVTVAQFSIGFVSLSQFTIAGFGVAQFAVAWSLIAQFGVFFHDGLGQFLVDLSGLF